MQKKIKVLKCALHLWVSYRNHIKKNMIFSPTNRVSKSVFCFLGISNSRIPGRKAKPCALCQWGYRPSSHCAKALLAVPWPLVPLSHACSDARSFFLQKEADSPSTAQQPDDNAPADRNSAEGTVGLITDLFFAVTRRGFFGVSLHGDEFDRHPQGSTELT